MGYNQELMVGGAIPESTAFLSAQSITQAAAVYGVYTAHYPFIVQRFSFKISTAVFNLTGSVIAANLVTGLQNATPVTAQIGTLTIPNGATAGTVYFNNVSPTLVQAGQQLQFALKTQGGLGGTPAGAGFIGWYGSVSSERASNETNPAVILLTA